VRRGHVGLNIRFPAAKLQRNLTRKAQAIRSRAAFCIVSLARRD
jgi:hypothetical protein